MLYPPEPLAVGGHGHFHSLLALLATYPCGAKPSSQEGASGRSDDVQRERHLRRSIRSMALRARWSLARMQPAGKQDRPSLGGRGRKWARGGQGWRLAVPDLKPAAGSQGPRRLMQEQRPGSAVDRIPSIDPGWGHLPLWPVRIGLAALAAGLARREAFHARPLSLRARVSRCNTTRPGTLRTAQRGV